MPGVRGSFTITTGGFSPPSISDHSAHLPSGVTFTNNGNGTATLAGTPTKQSIGAYTLTLSASNGIVPNATQNFTLTVQGPPKNSARPAIKGKLLRGETVTCSPGRWTNNPTFAYQWYRWNTPLHGATKAKYVIQKLDQGSRMSCQVTATNPAGHGSALSPRRHITIPFVKGCPQATGKIEGTTLGLVHLGVSAASVRHVYRFSVHKSAAHAEYFCFSPAGTYVGYASSGLIHALDLSPRLHGDVVWTTSGNPRYEISGIRVGATLKAVKHAVRHGSLYRLGGVDWYVAANKAATVLVQLRSDLVVQVGIAVRAASDSSKTVHALLGALG